MSNPLIAQTCINDPQHDYVAEHRSYANDVPNERPPASLEKEETEVNLSEHQWKTRIFNAVKEYMSRD